MNADASAEFAWLMEIECVLGLYGRNYLNIVNSPLSSIYEYGVSWLCESTACMEKFLQKPNAETKQHLFTLVLVWRSS
jgi:hypothetical protein